MKCSATTMATREKHPARQVLKREKNSQIEKNKNPFLFYLTV
jgi:hypothetical protein